MPESLKGTLTPKNKSSRISNTIQAVSLSIGVILGISYTQSLFHRTQESYEHQVQATQQELEYFLIQYNQGFIAAIEQKYTDEQRLFPKDKFYEESLYITSYCRRHLLTHATDRLQVPLDRENLELLLDTPYMMETLKSLIAARYGKTSFDVFELKNADPKNKIIFQFISQEDTSFVLSDIYLEQNNL